METRYVGCHQPIGDLASDQSFYHQSFSSSPPQPAYSEEVERLVLVSNRLPVVLRQSDDGAWRVKPGSGGLVTALSPVLREREGLWIGWPGASEPMDFEGLLATNRQSVGYQLEPVLLSETEVDGYYRGFANEVLWPLFHDVQTRCHFDPAYWEMYQSVNRKFAQVVAKNLAAGDYIWVHDYHLILVATYLSELGVEQSLGFFLHTPFPPVDVFIKLPWRQPMMEGLMNYDFLGFQTSRDRNNFLACAEVLLEARYSDVQQPVVTITTESGEMRAGHFGISIDFDEFDQCASSPAIVEQARELQEGMAEGKLILGVDRLDYSKGIPERLSAFQRALERFPSLCGAITLVQVVVPSRVGIPEYQCLRDEIEQLVSRINGQFGTLSWTPIQYLFCSLSRNELVALYRAADIALITPLKDGMNLIAKEYCAANVEGDGVLILSEFAGAADELGRYSLLVNPYDLDGVAAAIYDAYAMGWAERQARMEKLRQTIKKQDIFRWLETFLDAALNSEFSPRFCHLVETATLGRV